MSERAMILLIACVQPDGGIYRKGLANYDTSISSSRWSSPRTRSTTPRSGKRTISSIGQQARNMADPTMDGGIGYGPNGAARGHPDLSNTVIALEAIRRQRGYRK